MIGNGQVRITADVMTVLIVTECWINTDIGFNLYQVIFSPHYRWSTSSLCTIVVKKLLNLVKFISYYAWGSSVKPHLLCALMRAGESWCVYSCSLCSFKRLVLAHGIRVLYFADFSGFGTHRTSVCSFTGLHTKSPPAVGNELCLPAFCLFVGA